MLTKSLLLLSTLTLMIAACQQRKRNNDPYYADHGDWDDERFPLIKPYEALNIYGSHQWYVQLTQDQDRLFAIPGVKEINLVNGVIFVHATKTILNFAEIKEAWFVLYPAKHIEKGFASHFAYQDYVYYLGFEAEPKLYKLNRVSHYFGEHDTIDWKHIED